MHRAEAGELTAWAADPLPRTKPEEVGMSSERLALIGRAINAEVAAGQLPGAVVAIARRGVGAPKNTPAEIIDKLNREVNAVLSAPKMKEAGLAAAQAVLAASTHHRRRCRRRCGPEPRQR